MMAAFVSLVSLAMTQVLVPLTAAPLTFPITGATTTTPIAITVANHGVPLGRVVHAVVSGVGGMPEADGTFILTPTDTNTFTLTGLTPQGIAYNSVGVNAYTSGGVASYVFPDYQILHGLRALSYSSAVAAPRIVFIPVEGRAWDFVPEGGLGSPPVQARGSLEQKSQTQNPQLATRYPTFEVHVSAFANPPSPDYGDFEATESLIDTLYSVLFDLTGGLPRCRVLGESWPSQAQGKSGSQTQRGQKCVLRIELTHPVIRPTLQGFVPNPVTLVETVLPLGGGSGDATTITIVSRADPSP